MRPLPVLALLALLPPGLPPVASALSAFPTEVETGPTEARFLLRVAPGALVRVEADAAVEAALVAPDGEPTGFVPVPAELRAPEGEWHGLSGVARLVVRRADPSQAVLVSASEGASGVAFEWDAAQAEVPSPGWAAPVACAAGAGLLALRGRRPRR